ncbi:hypothetical protein NIES22_35130 [Calothrix brevissima NIES-22]|nr:hypothetical protein NIES22_35130 [Calothrix brevissima NIES-22]
MEPRHLPFAWLKIIEDLTVPHQNTPLRQVLAIREQSSLLSGITAFVPALLTAFYLAYISSTKSFAQ